MATTAAPVEHNVCLSGVSWETYQRLLSEHEDASGTHFIYDEGALEIMVLSSRHERPKRLMEKLIDLLASAFSMDVCAVGSMTFQREDLRKGFEPDSAYYIARAREISGRDVDPAGDPPPDLIVEVDVTNVSLPRFPIYAAFGIPEIWRYDGAKVHMHRLVDGDYTEAFSSTAFPGFTPEVATGLLESGMRLRSTEFERLVRDWADQQL